MDRLKLNKWRKILLVALVILLIGIGGGIRLYRAIDRADAIDGKLTVHFIDVGQGDAALLGFPDGSTAMIDTGTAESADDVIAYLRRWDVDRLDRIFLSHGHSDHAGGLEAVCESFEVGEICYAGQAPTFDARNEDAPALKELTAGSMVEIGGVKVTVLAPITLLDEENDNSMILRLDYGERSFLFTGDAEEGEEESLLTVCSDQLDADVLKVGHHGSANSTSEAFVQAVTPQVAVISASADNSFGHPTPSVITRLKENGAIVYSTHEMGSVTLICDGKTIVRRSGDDFLALFIDCAEAGEDHTKKVRCFLKFQKNACNFLLNNV